MLIPIRIPLESKAKIWAPLNVVFSKKDKMKINETEYESDTVMAENQNRKTITLATELQDPVIKIEFWNRERELQISTYSEKVVHRELSNQTVGEKKEMSKADSETAIIVVSLAGETTAKQGRATHELSHNAFCFVLGDVILTLPLDNREVAKCDYV